MRHDGTPDETNDDLDAWSAERHRELEALVERDREAEEARRRDHDRAALAARHEARRRREAELPPELRDTDDDEPLSPGPRRRLVMGSSRVVAAITLVAVLALAAGAFL
ncbi:hypothetical protein EDF38_0537 [Frigoribacterium sp. PhB160]|uniref:hypothetical protein n=1 Tax=Frigoribacterium sp. PhB160 TaxID=2485192 RepID=UPI000F480C5B|nr:hypothetical protein [Frigoribacterium sp. PhB160]ROS61447.1 hypothetical protein EDF38_0537 [Frigoribacterium sp. PhB160]